MAPAAAPVAPAAAPVAPAAAPVTPAAAAAVAAPPMTSSVAIYVSISSPTLEATVPNVSPIPDEPSSVGGLLDA